MPIINFGQSRGKYSTIKIEIKKFERIMVGLSSYQIYEGLNLIGVLSRHRDKHILAALYFPELFNMTLEGAVADQLFSGRRL